MKFNGNGYTGGKYKFAKSLAMKINKIAKALEILDLVIYGRDVYENGEFGINESVESSVKAFSILGGIYGFSFGIGWDLGVEYGPIHRYMSCKNKY